jgi:polysaccharide biosynthesis protein VpsQ
MRKNIFWISIAVVFVIGIVLVIILADLVELPDWLTVIYAFPNGDKVGHFLLMGAAAFLINMALSDRSFRVGQVFVPYGPLIFALLVTAEEFSQQFFPHRTASWEDLIMSFLGILILGILPSRWLIRKLHRNQ